METIFLDTKCLDCGAENRLDIDKDITTDELGTYTSCLSCGSSYDVDVSFEYRRKPTPYEIRFGEGATHYKSFDTTLCRKPNGDLKRWLTCPVDGLRYFR